MARFNVSVCPVCDGSWFSPFITCTDFFVSGEEFQIKICDSCGFKITENIEDEENIGPYYQSENYISHSNTTKGFVNTVYHAVRKFMLVRKKQIVKNVTGLKKGNLLDVGTGTGFFADEMNKAGWKMTGIEKSSDARDFAGNEFNLEILPPEKLYTLAESQFDCITLWHVLEHIHNLEKNMEAYHRLLKPGGKLVIAVPNHESYDAKHYGECWAAWDVPRHIWHFAPRQMKLLAKKHGFEFLKIFTLPFDSFYVSMLSEKYKKSGLAFLRGIIHGKISWLNSVLKKDAASSVVYVFEKN